MSLLTEVLTISGVALDLLGAAVLSHAHNAKSIAEIGAEKSALGVVAAGLISTVFWTRFGRRVRERARQAERDGERDKLPEQLPARIIWA